MTSRDAAVASSRSVAESRWKTPLRFGIAASTKASSASSHFGTGADVRLDARKIGIG
jgi:hypothetical protein